MDPSRYRQWARPSLHVFILKQLNAAVCEGLAGETNQLLNNADISCSVWDDAQVQDDGDGCHYRMNVIWCYLSSVKSSDG